MSSISLSPGRAVRRPRPKHLLFGFVGAMLLIVLYNNERFLIQPDNPIWAHYRPFRWWLLVHGLAGALALLLGPMQFSDRLRRRYLTVHRIAGRLYVGGVALCAPLGVYIQAIQGPPLFTAAAATDAFLWTTTTGVALAFIRRGDVLHHRQWMVRSFAVALVFLEARVLLWAVPSLERMGVEGVMMAVWASLALCVPLADAVLACEELLRRRSAPPRAAAA